MAELFRKTSLEKLSSPEQLDRAIVITSPTFWVALLGGAVIIVVALVWSILGRIPVKVSTQGIFLSGDGTSMVCSEVAGMVTDISVESGAAVKRGDVVAVVGSGDITYQMELLSSRITSVEAVTLESTDQTITADNKALLDIKDEQIALSNSYQQALAALEQQQTALSKAKSEMATAKSQAERYEKAYYSALKDNGSSAAELAYGNAQTELSQSQSNYEAVAQTVAAAQQVMEQAKSAYETIKEQYDAQKALVDQLSQASGTHSQPVSEIPEAETSALEELVPVEEEDNETDETLQNAKDTLDSLKEQMDDAKSAYESAKDDYNNADNALDEAEASVNDATNALNSAKKKYLAELDDQRDAQTQQTISSNKYSVAQSDYVTKQSLVTSLKESVNSLQLQADAAKDDLDAQTEKIASAFKSTKASTLSSLQQELDQLSENLKKYEITTAADGVVQEVVTQSGAIVGQGSTILKLKNGDAQQREAVCYAAYSEGKKILPGMEVMVYPTTVNQQEYGHMIGTVQRVSEYATSQEELRKRLGDDTLVETFLHNGAVIEIVCTLEQDPSTASGYAWSSKKGANVILPDGTMLEASIVTEKKAPITMVIPLIKEFFSKAASSSNGEGA